MNKIDIPFFEIIKNDAYGYEYGRERCKDFYTTYHRISTLTDLFPEHSFNSGLKSYLGAIRDSEQVNHRVQHFSLLHVSSPNGEVIHRSD